MLCATTGPAPTQFDENSRQGGPKPVRELCREFPLLRALLAIGPAQAVAGAQGLPFQVEPHRGHLDNATVLRRQACGFPAAAGIPKAASYG